MNKTQCQLRNAFGLILLIVCCTHSAYAQPAAGSTSQPGERRRPGGAAETLDRRNVMSEPPLNSVLVRIRFKKEYGYKVESSQGGGPGVGSCDVFTVALAKPARPAVANVLVPVRRPEKITDLYGYYFCEFLISGLALDQDVTVGASVTDHGPWLGATQSLPGGYQRSLTDRERTVTLSQSNQRATMNFEVIYEPRTDFARPSIPSGSVIGRP